MKTNETNSTCTAVAVIPTACQTAIKPKPTKSEIVEAMLQLRIHEIQNENKLTREKMEAMRPKLEKELTQFVKKNFAAIKWDFGLGHPTCMFESRYGEGGKYIRDYTKLIDLDANANLLNMGTPIPDSLKSKLADYLKLHVSIQNWDEAKLRKEIKEGLDNGGVSKEERVQALLDSADSRKALQSVLNSITGNEAKTVSV